MSSTPRSSKTAEEREARLKAALKANMGRRKAQARARATLEREDATKAEQDKKD